MFRKNEATTITPRLAADWLKENTMNRPLRDAHVRKLASIMSAGEWMLNGDTIVFSDDRMLLDGQHRLHAVVLSGVSIKSFVVEGVERSAFSTIDRPKPRSSTDILCISGYKNAALLAATATLVHQVKSGYLQAGNKRKMPVEPKVILSVVEKYPDLPGSLILSNVCRAYSAISPSVICAANFIFREIDRSAAEVFINSLLTGVDLPMGSPILLLRERMTSIRDRCRKDKTSMVSVSQLAFVIKAWNAFRSNRKLGLLKYMDSEPFPVAI